ncbi:hypothetical protein J4558_25505 [Leptolyngbya sp. 15MV]|nr:hypothetical protein J4558_25505 [Leptolyngbya sp. 15MV]
MSSELQAVFAALRAILKPYEPHLIVSSNAPGAYAVDTKAIGSDGRPAPFASVTLSKSAVTFKLAPVVTNPHLLDEASAELRGRMKGEGAFNFPKSESALFAELGRITARGFAWFKEHGLLAPGPLTAETLDAARKAGGGAAASKPKVAKATDRAEAGKPARTARR